MDRRASAGPGAPDMSPNDALQPAVRERVEELDRETCDEWGGVWRDGTCHVFPYPGGEDYSTQTVVESPEDGLAAFEKYTEFFESVLHIWEKDSAAAVLLPCGSTKPIGTSSIHSKKVEALREAAFLPECDLAIVSEPCTIIPHEMRLSRPAVNYEFPPEYTDADDAPEVFEVFTDRLARWLDATRYEVIYPYLVSGHQAKLDAALEKADANPEVVEIPGASLNPETMNYSGDLFKTVDDIATKLEFIKALKGHGNPDLLAEYPDEVREFYQNRDEFQPAE